MRPEMEPNPYRDSYPSDNGPQLQETMIRDITARIALVQTRKVKKISTFIVPHDNFLNLGSL